MRTTLKLDDDVLAAAKSIAAVERKTLGDVVSSLLRSSLEERKSQTLKNGVPVFSRSNKNISVTVDLVNQLMDEDY